MTIVPETELEALSVLRDRYPWPHGVDPMSVVKDGVHEGQDTFTEEEWTAYPWAMTLIEHLGEDPGAGPKPEWSLIQETKKRIALNNRRELALGDDDHALADFRDAWEWVGDTARVRVNIRKARDIQRDIIRRERDAAWPDADANVFRAQDAGDAAAERKARDHRQKLRDAPASSAFGKARSVAALRRITLAGVTA